MRFFATDQRLWIIESRNLRLYHFKNLHANCYFNDDRMIITSMSLSEYSTRNFREMGILVRKGRDKDLFRRAVNETESILDSARELDPVKDDLPSGQSYLVRELVADVEKTKEDIRTSISFLKDDLEDVIAGVKNEDSELNIYTSTVFYRDEGDDYVTKKSGFTSDLSKTIQFISEQRAEGGGDFPEAVHTAVGIALNELQWSENARARIAFLVLDAPPHYTAEIKEEMNNLTRTAAAEGIKIIPVTASGIDKNTEFLMRFISMTTNGTYVFITDDSGVGNDHLEASVGEYEVELLNALMKRLILKYTAMPSE